MKHYQYLQLLSQVWIHGRVVLLIRRLTLEGIFKQLCKQWFRRLTSGHSYVFLRLLLSIKWSFNVSKYHKYPYNNPTLGQSTRGE